MAPTLSPEKKALLEQRLGMAAKKLVKGLVIPRRPNQHAAPLSFAQRQMWVIDQMTPGNPAYNLPVGYRIKGALDVTALEDSVNEIIKRHEILRTTFAVKDGDVLQLIHPALPINITVTELDHLPGEEREHRLQALASEESVRSFDLSRLPLIRVSLFKLGEAEHVVIINVHHIVADGLSVGLMLGELDTFYRAFIGGGDLRPPDLAVQYGDFAQWQRETLANEAPYANQIEFWRKQLSGGLPILELPRDMPRPTLQSFKGSNVFFNIPTSLAEDLRHLGAREGCTFFMTLLAAFQVLLQRHSGADDMVIGTPVAARTPREIEPLIGNFLNMAALRCDLSGNPTFIELLRRTRDTALNAFSNSDLPFEAMMKHLTFERDPSRNPIFQVLLQVLSPTAPRIGNLEISSFHFDLKFAQVDLSLLLYEDVGGYWGRFEYCTDLFEAQTIRRLCGHYGALLQAIVRDPDRSIAMLPLLTDAEQQQLLVEWNETKTDYPANALVHELFEAQVERIPEAIAVEFDGKRLTYRELNARANQVAHHLRHLGIGSDTLVGVCVERSIEMVTALLAVLKTGAGYVPLDPAYPDERLAFMLGDANVAVLLTQERLRSRFEHRASDPWPGRAPIKIVSIDAQEQGIAQADSQNLLSDNVPENLAYVIYTSGSTGSPKGVEITHRSLVNLLNSMRDQLPFTEQETLLAVTTISFDIAGLEIYLPLITGAKVVLASREDAFDGTKLLRRLTEHGVTAMQATPSTWRLLLEAGWQGSARFKILCGGEAFAADLAEPLRKRGTVWNLYGPTETTIWSMAHRVAPGDGPIPIGRPIANTEVYILDAHLQPVPIGVAGELYIGGAGLARGYHNQLELTARKFIRNPFTNDPSVRLYRTGDLVRYLPDGEMEFIGRMDNQVKIRGFRIELAEVENTLGQYPKIRETAVLVREDRPGDKRLVAYVVRRQNHHLTIDEIRSHLKKKLPEYMVPSVFIVLESLPLTPNGKVDRKALPAPAENRPEIVERYRAPRTGVEDMLASIWAEVLNVQKVGVHDNFFDLGGHSLLAVRVVQCIEKRIGRPVRVTDIFQAPTVEQLSRLLDNNEPLAPWSSLVPLQTKGFKAPFFWVHGDISDAYLPRYLDAEQPLYGLNHQSTDGQRALYTTVENIASHYLEEILTVQRRGPYRLGGNCFGGLVAFEMAKQLEARGQTVDLLMLLNPAYGEDDHSSNPSSGFLRNNVSRCVWAFQSARHRTTRWLIKGVLNLIADKISSVIGSAKRPIQKAVYKTYLWLGFPIPVSLRSRYILDIYARATASYTVKEYSGNMVLVFGHDYPQHLRLDWTKRNTGSVKIHEVPGDHEGVLDDINVKLWAEQLAAYLESLDNGQTGLKRAVG
jgi:amino acid adenylation domain-containing protein